MTDDEQDEQNHLNRDWIDWSMTKDLIETVQAGTQGNEIAIGIGLATYALCAISAVRSMKPEYQPIVMHEIFTFMTDLYNNGWDSPPDSKEKLQ